MRPSATYLPFRTILGKDPYISNLLVAGSAPKPLEEFQGGWFK